MLKKLKLAAVALLLPLIAFGQSYPSPTFQNLTVLGNSALVNATITGTFTASGKVGLPSLAAQAANTVVGNATSGSASPTAITVTGCNGAAQALQWTNGTGFGCNSSVATSGANANITSLSGLTTPLSVSQGGTGGATLAQYQPLAGSGTGAITTLGTGTAGQVLTSNGNAAYPTFQTLSALAGRLLNVQRFTSSGTYTPTAGTNSVIVECLGGGGGGGGAPSTAAGQQSAGASGGAGAYVKSRITSAFSGVTVTVGAAGTTASGAAGGNGGTTTFGAILTAPGGSGGGLLAAGSGSATAFGGNGASTATGGNIVNAGGMPAGGATINPAIVQPGGNTAYGGGGQGAFQATGGAATGFGAGGGGTLNGASQAALTGGAATAGLCIIYEYN